MSGVPKLFSVIDLVMTLLKAVDPFNTLRANARYSRT